MSTILPEKPKFENAPSGSHLAICYGVIDLGTQLFKSQQWGDETANGILLQFELPHEVMQDGRPFMINKKLKLKAGKNSGYRKFIEAWRGIPFSDADFGKFDTAKVLGKAASLSVTHDVSDKGTFANISAIMQPMKGISIPAPVNNLVHFTFDNFNQEIYDSLSDWLKAMIALSPEYQELKGVPQNDPHTPSESDYGAPLPDTEIPF